MWRCTARSIANSADALVERRGLAISKPLGLFFNLFRNEKQGADMNREVINPQELPAVNPTYSQAIKANGMIFVAGQIGIDPATGKLISSDIAEQTHQAIENTATILKAAGSRPASARSTHLY